LLISKPTLFAQERRKKQPIIIEAVRMLLIYWCDLSRQINGY